MDNGTIQQVDYLVNLEQVLLWQNESSTNLRSIINNEQLFYEEEHTKFWEDWYTGVFWLWNNNPLDQPGSFTEFGASVWSVILGISLQIGPGPEPVESVIYQFGQEGNFDQSTFSNSGDSICLKNKMLLLRLRYFQLVTRGAIPEINAFLKPLFEWYGYNGEVYAVDNLNMTMDYFFTSPISLELQNLIDLYDILPRPAGVKLDVIVMPSSLIAFDNPQNFDNGRFLEGT